jgi:flagellar protein FlaJ
MKLASSYRKFCYKIFKFIDSKPHPGISQQLYKADIRMPPGMYLGTIMMTAIIVTSAVLAASFFIFSYLIKTDLWMLITLGMTLATMGISLIALPFITADRVTSKRVKINSNLPFVLAYMATLSAAGMNPVETVRHVALKDFGPTSREFRKIVYRSDVLGEDVITAINVVANQTASEVLHDTLLGVANIIFSGGSLKDYCEQEAKGLFDDKKAKLKGFIDSLASFCEAYLGGVVVPIVLLIIGLIIIGMLGIKIGFFSTQNLFDIFVFFGLPFINIVILVLLELKFSGGEF